MPNQQFEPSPRIILASAAIVATVATTGSLFLSLGLGLIPCKLCWYQRILMYPLPVILGIGALDRRPTAIRTALPLALPGFGLAAYHSSLQATTNQAQCTIGSCGAIQYQVLGLTIPNLSLIAFSLIILLCLSLNGRVRQWLAAADGVPTKA